MGVVHWAPPRLPAALLGQDKQDGMEQAGWVCSIHDRYDMSLLAAAICPQHIRITQANNKWLYCKASPSGWLSYEG